MSRSIAALLVLLATLSSASPLCAAHAAEPVAAEDSTEVVVTGMGVTAEAARKDAWRSAVLQATGGLVSAETLVRNSVLVRDEVLSYADGYVDKYTEFDRRIVDGLVVVDARVLVRRTELRQRLEALQLVVPVNGVSIAATIATQVKQQADGREMLARALVPFRDSVTRVDLVGQPEVVLSDGAARLRYRARASIDRERYSAALRQLETVLDAVAVEKAEAVGTPSQLSSCNEVGAAERNRAEPHSFVCMVVFDRPLDGESPASAAATEYLVRRDVLPKEELPFGHHRMHIVLAGADGRPLLGATRGPCSAESPIRGLTNCADARHYFYRTTGVEERGGFYAFVGSIPMYSEVKGMRYGSFDFEFEVEGSADVFSEVTTARVVLEYVTPRR